MVTKLKYEELGVIKIYDASNYFNKFFILIFNIFSINCIMISETNHFTFVMCNQLPRSYVFLYVYL